MDSRKWFTRIGSFLVLMGFFLPSVLVSCSSQLGLPGLPDVSQSFSLADLANSPVFQQGLLYLVPILILGVIVLSFMSASFPRQSVSILWGQVACAAISALVILITAINLSGQSTNLGGAIVVKPAFGAFMILGGYIMASVGLWGQFSGSSSSSVRRGPQMDWNQPAQNSLPVGGYPPPPPPPVGGYSPLHNSAVPSGISYHLELVAGQVEQTYIPLQRDNILLGRSSDCDVQLRNATISRQHARLRFADDAWYIQDQDSTGGTLVNGQPVRASRLNPGDRISLGDVTFIFKS